VQGAGGEDDEAGAQRVSAVGFDEPQGLLVQPAHPSDHGLEEGALVEAEVAADAAGVLEDLRRPGILALGDVAGLL
jgi:hypothetical protein